MRRLLLSIVILAALLPVGTASASGAADRVPVPVRFEIAGPAARQIAEDCALTWRTEGPELTRRLLPRDVVPDTVVCLVLDTASFRRNFGNVAPDWGVGIALGNGRVIAVDYQRLPAVGRGVREVFLHEMVHALLFQGARGAWLPTWLHEGAAMLFAGEWRFTDTVSLVLEGRVPDLAALQGPFPGSVARAGRAYRTSLLAAERLVDGHGPDVIRDLAAATAVGRDFPAAFLQVTGTSDTAFYADFAGAMRLRFGWAVMLTRWPGLFVLLGLVLLVGGGAKLVRNRRRLAAMDDDPWEPPAGS